MRILHALFSEGFYGSERYCAELASYQARAGHEVRVLISGANLDAVADFGQALPKLGQLIVMPAWWPRVLYRPYTRMILRQFAPQIVHSHLDPAARRVGHVAETRGIAHIATLHLDFHKREHGGCAGLICIADWQRTTIAADYAGRVTTIHNWLSDQVACAIIETTDQAVAALRGEWGADAVTVVFCSVGRLAPEKAMDRMIASFRDAFPRGDENVRLVIVGDGPRRAALNEAAGNDRRIIFCGWQQNPAPYYRACDVYVSAAPFEPFGLTILEAMAAGCRLLLTRAGGPVEFVNDKQVLWVEKDGLTLAALLRQCAGGRLERASYDLRPFSIAAVGPKIDAFYRGVLSRPHETARHAS